MEVKSIKGEVKQKSCGKSGGSQVGSCSLVEIMNFSPGSTLSILS